MTRLAPALIVLALAIAPSSALAATAGVADGELRYAAAAGERNAANIALSEAGDAYVITEYRDGPIGATLEAGPGCTLGNSEVRCPKAGVTRIAVSLGDLDDSFQVGYFDVPVTLSAGAGTDFFQYLYTENALPLTVTADGKPDDGPAGRDNIGTDVETIYGAIFADTLANGPGGGRLVGREGDDRMTGNAGDDVIEAAYVEDVGTDSGSFYRMGTDTLGCGGGRDFVLADSTDTIAPDCEIVGKNTKGGFRFTGSHGNDRIETPSAWAPAGIYGRGGNDLILVETFGPANVYGGAGNDRIQGASGYSNQIDRIEGGSGNDRIRTRDKAARRDIVVCGPGRDTAIVDRRDRVSGCERVLRSR